MTKKNMTFRKLLAMLLIIMIGVTFTPSFAVEAFASTGEDLTLTLVDENKTQYVEGEPIYVKATGDTEGAWVALYLETDVKDDPAVGGSHSFRWYYVAERSGYEVDITDSALAQGNPRGAVKPGKYVLILFGDGGYSKVLKTIPIEVIENPDKEANPSDELSLKLVDEGKTTYKIGEPINIIATGTAPGAWVGLYKAEDIKDDPANGGSMSTRWYYTADRNGEIVNITNAELDLNNKGGLKEGSYEIVLFGDGGYSLVEKTIPITIEGMIDIDESQFSLEVEKTDYKYKDQIKVKATGKGINDGAWVGMYPADMNEYGDSYMYFYYVRDYEGVFTAIQSKTAGATAERYVPHGKYELVLFADGGYDFPVKKVGITVTRDALSLKVIREASCATIGIEYAVYEDGTAEYREIPSMGGHDWDSTAVKIPGKNKHQYSCKRDADHKKKVEKCTFGEGIVITPATTEESGVREYTCTVCNGKYKETIYKLRLKEEPALSYTKTAYNGKHRKPAVKTIYDKFGNVVPKSSYTVTYPKNSKNVGTYTATVKFTGDYAGTYKLTYKVNPKGVALTNKTKGKKKSFTAAWKKAGAQVTGYRIKYSTDKNFKKNVSYKKIKKVKTTSTTVKNLKAKKKYYVKVRTYKVVNGKTYYSAWSKSRYVTTKAK